MTRTYCFLRVGIYDRLVDSGNRGSIPVVPAGNPAGFPGFRLVVLILAGVMLVLLSMITVTLLLMAGRQKQMLIRLTRILKSLETRPGNHGSSKQKAGGGPAQEDTFSHLCTDSDDTVSERDLAEDAAPEGTLLPGHRQTGTKEAGFNGQGGISEETGSGGRDIGEPISGERGDRKQTAAPAQDVFAVHRVSVNDNIHYNPQNPVSFTADENGMMELLSDNTIVPRNNCFLNYNTTAFFSRFAFFHVYDFLDRNGNRIGSRHQIHLLEIEKPAYVRRTQGSMILSEKGVLIAEEK